MPATGTSSRMPAPGISADTWWPMQYGSDAGIGSKLPNVLIQMWPIVG